MMVSVTTSRTLAFLLLLTPALLCAQKPDKHAEKAMAGPRATALRQATLFIAPDVSSQHVDRVQEGRELVVAETSGAWIRVFANTDQEEVDERDAPVYGQDTAPPPVSGWMQAKGVIRETDPAGDQVLMGEAINLEILAEDARGPRNAGQSARFLYRRLAEFYPNSPLAAEAAWRAADIRWQFEKADASRRPSAKERDPYLREQLYEDEMKKVIKSWPHSRQADLAAFALIDNKLCGDWQGQEKCPEKESQIYESYVKDHPDGPRTAQALYQAVYRQAVLSDMYRADDSQKKSDAAHAHAKELAAALLAKFPTSEFTSRAATLVYKLDQGVAVYGSDRD